MMQSEQVVFSLIMLAVKSKAILTVRLEQSSTMADMAEVEFTNSKVKIPSCFYEFAKRYPLESGELYTGFVAASADKIFESTNNNG